MAAVYSRLFFKGLVLDGIAATVPLASSAGTVVIRTVRVVYPGSLPVVSWGVSDSTGVIFLYAAGLAGPFSDVQEGRDVWPAGVDMTLSCTGADMNFWVTGYLLTP
jgi:hypothetical protein